jgi:hypothetical protein
MIPPSNPNLADFSKICHPERSAQHAEHRRHQQKSVILSGVRSTQSKDPEEYRVTSTANPFLTRTNH